MTKDQLVKALQKANDKRTAAARTRSEPVKRTAPLDGSLTVSARGQVLPEVAWQRYAEIARWPQWSPQIASVRASAERIAPGVTGTVRSPIGVGVPFTVDEVDEPGRSWTWTVRIWPVRVRLSHTVRPAHPGTRTDLQLHGPLPVLLAYAPLARLALRRLVRA